MYMSTGDGKIRESSELRTTIFKRAIDITYNLKLKTSRQFFSDVQQRFPTMMFTLRAFEDLKVARMGVNECSKHELLNNYPVLVERNGEFVAHFKGTVLILPQGP